LQGTELSNVQQRAIESSLRFVDAHPTDARTPGVLTNTAEKLYAQHDPARAVIVAQRILDLQPPAPADMRRTAWTVIAHTEFDRGAYDRSEAAYQQVLALTDAKAASRVALTERLAASVYKQGEQARKDNRQREAVGHFSAWRRCPDVRDPRDGRLRCRGVSGSTQGLDRRCCLTRGVPPQLSEECPAGEVPGNWRCAIWKAASR